MIALPSIIRTIRWMVRDTFRQSLASKLFWVMLGLTSLCTMLCLGTSIDAPPQRKPDPGELPLYMPKAYADEKVYAEGIAVPDGKVRLGFGLVEYPITKSKADAVKNLQLWLAGVLADTAGVLLALLWTAGFLPAFLEPNSVSVLLAKPAPRWAILLGKYLGVILFVTLQAILFVTGTWFGIGIATGEWDGSYWAAVPLLVVNFTIFYSVSTFFAVCTRSTVVSIFGTLLFWLLCWGMNFTHHRLIGFDTQGVTQTASFMMECGYWILPKPLDLSGLFFDILHAESHSIPVPELTAMKQKNALHPELAVLSSLIFAAATMLLTAYEFKTTDY